MGVLTTNPMATGRQSRIHPAVGAAVLGRLGCCVCWGKADRNCFANTKKITNKHVHILEYIYIFIDIYRYIRNSLDIFMIFDIWMCLKMGCAPNSWQS